MLFQNEIDLIKAMRAVLKQPSRASFDYALIFADWLLYTNGYSILWVYDPVRFKGIAGACPLDDIEDPTWDIYPAYTDLTDAGRLGLMQHKLPLADEGALVSSIEAYTQAEDMISSGPAHGSLDPNWVFTILDLFCPVGEVCSVHPGPAPRYLDREAGVWFKSGSRFLGVLPLAAVDKNKCSPS